MMYLDLFITFFKIGLFTIGGGYAMIPLIQQEVVAHGWLTLLELTDFIAVAESTPGPFAVNIATFVGMEMGGFRSTDHHHGGGVAFIYHYFADCQSVYQLSAEQMGAGRSLWNATGGNRVDCLGSIAVDVQWVYWS